MLSDEEMKARQELIELHRMLVERYESLIQIECTDESFNQLISSVKLLVQNSAELVAETATAYFPVEAGTPRPTHD